MSCTKLHHKLHHGRLRLHLQGNLAQAVAVDAHLLPSGGSLFLYHLPDVLKTSVFFLYDPFHHRAMQAQRKHAVSKGRAASRGDENAGLRKQGSLYLHHQYTTRYNHTNHHLDCHQKMI